MQKRKKTTGLVWFTNNLRVQDNLVLAKACAAHENLVGVFVFDPLQYEKTKYGFTKTGRYRAQFLIETVTALQVQLAQNNITLLTYFDRPKNAIASVCKSYEISDIYYQKEWTHEEVVCIQEVENAVAENIKFHEYYDQFLASPSEVFKVCPSIPEVFTNFRKKIEKFVRIPSPIVLEDFPRENTISQTTTIPQLTDLGFTPFEQDPRTAFPFKGGEDQALQRVQQYFFEGKHLGKYKHTRNGLIGVDYSSKVSPWLANGSISARTIYQEVKKYELEVEKNQSTYWLIFELLWRDYFKYIALQYKDSIFYKGGILNRHYEWRNDSKDITSWIEGTTPDDFVNANMLELKNTGWMSNRGRQNVASYFAKELLLDWRIGAAYFESLLIDYDVHSNYGNWMYVSGVGNDPRDRKFNVSLQAERYDGQYQYRSLWLQPSLFS